MNGYNPKFFSRSFLNNFRKSISESLAHGNGYGIGVNKRINEDMRIRKPGEPKDVERTEVNAPITAPVTTGMKPVDDLAKKTAPAAAAPAEAPRRTFGFGKTADRLSDLELKNLMRDKKNTSIFNKNPKQSDEYLELEAEFNRRQAAAPAAAPKKEPSPVEVVKKVMDAQHPVNKSPSLGGGIGASNPLIDPNVAKRIGTIKPTKIGP